MESKTKWAVIQPLIGGFPLGAAEAIGHKPEFIISSENLPNDLHLINYWPNVPFLTLNSEDEWSTEEMKTQFEKLNKNIDLVVGTPICSGLSQLNVNASSDSLQNENMYNLAKIILDKINPRVYIFENAPGLYSKMGAPVVEKLNNIATEFNYVTTAYKTNTYLHGIPQNRLRTFFFFWRQDDDKYKVPELEYFKKKTPDTITFLETIPENTTHNKLNSFFDTEWQQVFIDYCENKIGPDWRVKIRGNKKIISFSNYLFTNNKLDDFLNYISNERDDISEKQKEKIKRKFDHAKYKLSIGKGYWEYSVVAYDISAMNTITSKGASHFVHPKENRGFTIRELMTFMGLPFDFNLVKNSNGKYPENHISQNVPVKTARDIVATALNALNGKLPFINGAKHVKQNNIKRKIEEGFTSKSTFSDYF